MYIFGVHLLHTGASSTLDVSGGRDAFGSKQDDLDE